MCHAYRSWGVIQDRGDMARERGGVKPGFGDEDRCLCGDEDRRPAHDRDVGDRGGAGTRDHKLRLGQPPRHIGEEGLHLGADAGCGIGGDHALHVLGAGLVGDAEIGAERLRQERERGGHHVGEDARALAAADHEDAHRIVAGAPARSSTAARTGFPV